MDKVIEYANKITDAGFTLEPAGKYFQDFAWDNSDNLTVTYLVYTTHQAMYRHQPKTAGKWACTTTKHQMAGTALPLADFYNSFEASDERRGVAYPGLTDKVGLRAGFAVGQQYGPGSVKR
jgi:hypothetical protein